MIMGPDPITLKWEFKVYYSEKLLGIWWENRCMG